MVMVNLHETKMVNNTPYYRADYIGGSDENLPENVLEGSNALQYDSEKLTLKIADANGEWRLIAQREVPNEPV